MKDLNPNFFLAWLFYLITSGLCFALDNWTVRDAVALFALHTLFNLGVAIYGEVKK